LPLKSEALSLKRLLWDETVDEAKTSLRPTNTRDQIRQAPFGKLSVDACDKIRDMKLTAVFEPPKEGGYTCFIEEIPAVICQGETLAEGKVNLLDALKLLLQCQRELVEKPLSPEALHESIGLPDP
jgi:predicted RNase H-like HicB family nuclease